MSSLAQVFMDDLNFVLAPISYHAIGNHGN